MNSSTNDYSASLFSNKKGAITGAILLNFNAFSLIVGESLSVEKGSKVDSTDIIILLIICIPLAYWIGRRRAIAECENWLARHQHIVQYVGNVPDLLKMPKAQKPE